MFSSSGLSTLEAHCHQEHQSRQWTLQHWNQHLGQTPYALESRNNRYLESHCQVVETLPSVKITFNYCDQLFHVQRRILIGSLNGPNFAILTAEMDRARITCSFDKLPGQSVLLRCPEVLFANGVLLEGTDSRETAY